MTTQIYFDSTDWKSIREMIKGVNEHGAQLAETEEGESIMFDVSSYNSHDVLVTRVLQSNGWTRINTYDPEDFTVEETYKRE